jgi:hypothetical protein
MSARPVPPTSRATREATDATIRRMRAAVENADVDGFLATLESNVVLRSPITEKTKFVGLLEMRELMEAAFATIEDIRYYEELGDERSRSLFYRAHIGSQPIEEACLVYFGADGRVSEFTLWIRPMPALTRLAATLGPQLASSHSRAKAAVVATAARPLAFLTAKADGPLSGLARPRRTDRSV